MCSFDHRHELSLAIKDGKLLEKLSDYKLPEKISERTGSYIEFKIGKVVPVN
jgi:hypothetical protein